MVVCKYFQTGNCRFGSKCINEHFDVKQYIKTEVEAALRGSQWPLSCFGLFKEKPCIPNFIEDKSFEECRFLCYKAKQENQFPAYHQQFNQQVMAAQNKMKSLLSLNRDIVDSMIKLYDDAELAQKGGGGSGNGGQQQQQNVANPFSMGTIPPSSSQQNPFVTPPGYNFGGASVSTGNLFGAGAASTTPSSGSVLGQSAFGSSGFGGTGSSVFGGGQTQQQPQQQQQQQQQQQGGAAFSFNQLGQQNANQTQEGNIFGMTAQNLQSGGSLFGGGMQHQQQQQQSQQPQQQQTPFGNAFGGNAGQVQLQQQQQPVSGGNLFGQNSMTPPGGFGSFGQQQGNSVFGLQQSSGMYGQQMQQPQQQPQEQHQQQQFQHLQQQHAQTAQQLGGQNIFGHKAFGQTQPQPQVSSTGPFGGSQQQGNAFGTNQSSPFGAPINYPGGQMNQQNSFQQQMPPQAQITASVQFNDSIYSKIEDLTQEEIEAFKADQFILGKLPTKPPPRDFIL